MGKDYIAIMPDGTQRFAAALSTGRAKLFFDIASLLERYVDAPCGISPDAGADEHIINPELFIPFFERVWNQDWLTECHGGFLAGWAAHAAGMIENITFQRRAWVDRQGVELPSSAISARTKKSPPEHERASYLLRCDLRAGRPGESASAFS